MLFTDPDFLLYWRSLTRLGEAQVLLPAALLTALAVLRRPQARPLAAWWLLLLSAAALLTTATKVAFFGWGVGWPELNFTGVSGHTMFAAAVISSCATAGFVALGMAGVIAPAGAFFGAGGTFLIAGLFACAYVYRTSSRGHVRGRGWWSG